ncbi:MAG: DUF3276 family protein [Bacteroidota bacterium]|nr:DUF3276 family protein [Bacteroidota bacterium]
MEDATEKKEGNDNYDRQDVFSKAVRAGRRTYFFDVKATRRNDYYLTITESKKRFNRDGKPFFEKHKIFLYKEDFEKFSDGLAEVIEFIKEAKPVILDRIPDESSKTSEDVKSADSFTNVEFEDLGEKPEE